MAAHTIQFTQEQARRLSDVTPEAWRHWRSIVPHLNGKRGKAARFSIGDIVALSVMHHAVHDLGASVARLSSGFEMLCKTLGPLRPTAMADMVALVGPTSAALVSVDETMAGWPPFAVAVPCRPIVERLASTTFEAIPDVQPPLPFAPRVVRRG